MSASPDLLDTPAAGSAAIRGGALRVGGYTVGVALTVGSAAVLFRHLGVVDAGRYVLVLSVVTLSAGLTDAGLSTISVREFATYRGAERKALMSNLLGLRIAFSVLGVAVACLYTAAAGLGAALVGATAIVGVGVLAQNLQTTFATALMANLRLGWVTAIELVRQAATASIVVALVLVGAGLVPFFAASATAGVVALALTMALTRGTMPFRPSRDLAAWRAVLRETLPFALAAAVGAVYFRLAILLVDLLASDRQVGYFGASFRVIEVIVIVPQLIVGAGFPIFARAARDDIDRLRYGVQRMFEASLVVGALVALVLAVAAPAAIAVVGGSDFDPAVGVLRLHAAALAGSFTAAVFGYALLALRRHREVLLMSLVALATSLTALAILVPLDGARGGALGTLLGEVAFALAGWVLLARSGMRLELRNVPRVALAAAIAVCPALIVPAVPAAVLAGVLFAVVLLALRGVPEEVLVELRRLRA